MRRHLISRRGVLSLIALALIWALVLVNAIAPISGVLARQDFAQLAELAFNRLGFGSLTDWASPELAVYWGIGLYLLPVFVLTMAADQMASDRARGTLRFLLPRVSRSQLFLGRFTGQAIVQAMVVLASLSSVLVVVALDTPSRVSAALPQAAVVGWNLWLALLPYLALMAALSAQLRSARRATLLAVILWLALAILISWIQRRFGPIDWLDYLLPGAQIPLLTAQTGLGSLSLTMIPVLQSIVLLGVGWWGFRRADL